MRVKEVVVPDISDQVKKFGLRRMERESGVKLWKVHAAVNGTHALTLKEYQKLRTALGMAEYQVV
jgi:hypothetical protein